MRGLKVVRRFGVGTDSLKGVMFRFGSRIVALISASSLMSRFSKSRKNEAFFFEIGPLRLPPYCCDRNGGRSGANGLRELKVLSLKLKESLAAKLISARLGQDFDAAETHPVILG